MNVVSCIGIGCKLTDDLLKSIHVSSPLSKKVINLYGIFTAINILKVRTIEKLLAILKMGLKKLVIEQIKK